MNYKTKKNPKTGKIEIHWENSSESNGSSSE